MAVCAKCGGQLNEGATFCGSCGTAVAAAAGSAPGATAATPAPAAPAGTAAGGMSANIAALLSYLFWPITCILFLVLEPYNKDKFVRFHAFQALFLGIAAIALSIGLAIVTTILAFIPVLGWILDLLLWVVFGFGMLGLAIFMMYKAYQNERYMLPVIGKLAAQQAG